MMVLKHTLVRVTDRQRMFGPDHKLVAVPRMLEVMHEACDEC